MGVYDRRARCSHVVDGDTIDLDWLDQGFGDFKMGIAPREGDRGDPLRFRLAAVNAYETALRGDTTPEQKAIGIEARTWLRELIEGKYVRIRTVKAGKRGNLGRYLAYVFLDGPVHDNLDPMDPETCINLMLLDNGFAVVSKYEDGAMYDDLGYPREEK